jgi:hypothetical protein
MSAEWSPTAFYNYGDVVIYNGGTYGLNIAGADYPLGTPPDSGDTWYQNPPNPTVNVPSVPSDVKVNSETYSTAVIQLVFDPSVAVGPITNYVASIKTPIGADEPVQLVNLALNTIYLSGLTPETRYNFGAVDVSNSAGSVTYLLPAPIFIETTAVPPAPITNVVVSDIMQTRFVIEWSGGTSNDADYVITLNGLEASTSYIT